MTAPPADHDAAFAGWLAVLERINQQISLGTLHRKVWVEIRDAVIDRYPDKDGTFINSYGDVYWDSQVMLVRRLADRHPQAADSVYWLYDGIRRNPAVISRRRYVGIRLAIHKPEPDTWEFKREADRADREFSERYGAGEHVDPSLIERQQAGLKSEVAKIDNHADQWVAHRDPRGSIQDLTFADVHAAVGRVTEHARFLNALLRQTDFRFDALMLSARWKDPLRGPLFDPGPEPQTDFRTRPG